MEVITEKKARITDIATRLFREKGYAATSMRDLAQEVGIEAASLYSHVKSKEEILSRICFTLAEAFFTAQHQALQPDDSSPEALRKAVEAHVGVVAVHLSASGVFLHEWRHLSEPSLSQFLELRQQYEIHWLKLLRRGKDEGVFHYEDEAIAVRHILSALNWIYDWYKPNGRYSVAQLSAHISQLIIQGIQ